MYLYKSKGDRGLDDTELLEMLQNNPQEGIRKAIESYGGLVYSIVYAKLHIFFTKEDIEECVSDVFVDLYKQIDQINLEKGRIKGLITIIAKRKAVRYINRKKVKFDSCSLNDEDFFYEPESSDNVEQIVIESEERKKLREAILQLKEVDASIMVMKFFSGMTAKDIGLVINMSKNAVEKRIARSIRILKKIMEEDYE